MRCAGYIERMSSRSGQSLVESCVVIVVTCFIFMGLYQLSQLFAFHEFLNYSAARGARAATVGFNDFMVWKTARLGVIPNAGRMTAPGFESTTPWWNTETPRDTLESFHGSMVWMPGSPQFAVERSRMPLYLGAEWPGELDPILDYEDWDTVEIENPVGSSIAGTISMAVRQDVPLKIPLHEMFITGDSVEFESRDVVLENHSQIYLE